MYADFCDCMKIGLDNTRLLFGFLDLGTDIIRLTSIILYLIFHVMLRISI